MPTFHIHDAASGVDLHLPAGWTGLVGTSRADELSFLRVVTAGDVVRVPARCAAIAEAVARAPAVLVVDDLVERVTDPPETLLGALRDHAGVGLAALRDRELLDALTTSTIRIVHGSARLYAAGYVAARAMWQAEGEARGRERAVAASAHARLDEQAMKARQAADHARTAAHAAQGQRNYTHGRRTSRGK
jgi:hypothetical protein